MVSPHSPSQPSSHAASEALEIGYKNIMVAVDNSEYSESAMQIAISLARLAGARLTGNHVYAARLHDIRFRQLEPGLPERYQQENILQKQRDIHDDLIGRGLRIISDSYLALFESRCQEAGITGARKIPEGRNYEELIRDTKESGYDLVLLGAHGLGRVERSVIGSVCERVLHAVECDVLVAREPKAVGDGPILVGVDGSEHSFAALRVALELAESIRAANPSGPTPEVHAVAAYDPFFHIAAFQSVAGVLSAEAASIFRFREQEKLHDEIIDDGMKHFYNSHLVVAQKIARARGIELTTAVLEGKSFDALCSYIEKIAPSLTVLGREGIHRGKISGEDGDGDRQGIKRNLIGSTAENVVRLGRGNVLVVGRVLEGDRQARAASQESEKADEEPICWSAEAEIGLERVPVFARPMARRAIEQFARENGYGEVTADVFAKARGKFGM